LLFEDLLSLNFKKMHDLATDEESSPAGTGVASSVCRADDLDFRWVNDIFDPLLAGNNCQSLITIAQYTFSIFLWLSKYSTSSVPLRF
jgi:hypothetical protein